MLLSVEKPAGYTLVTYKAKKFRPLASSSDRAQTLQDWSLSSVLAFQISSNLFHHVPLKLLAELCPFFVSMGSSRLELRLSSGPPTKFQPLASSSVGTSGRALSICCEHGPFKAGAHGSLLDLQLSSNPLLQVPLELLAELHSFL